MEKDGVTVFESKEERELWERVVVSYMTIPHADPITVAVKADILIGKYRDRRTPRDREAAVEMIPAMDIVLDAPPPKKNRRTGTTK